MLNQRVCLPYGKIPQIPAILNSPPGLPSRQVGFARGRPRFAPLTVHRYSALSTDSGIIKNRMPLFRLPVFQSACSTVYELSMRYGSCKDKKGAKYYDVPLFLAPLIFTRDSRENENYPCSQSREDGRTDFYKFVSLRVRKFSSERRPDL